MKNSVANSFATRGYSAKPSDRIADVPYESNEPRVRGGGHQSQHPTTGSRTISGHLSIGIGNVPKQRILTAAEWRIKKRADMTGF